MTNPYPVGAFLLTRSTDTVGRAIAAGQALIGDGTRYTHAALVIDGQQVVEAAPDGARIVPLAKYAGRLDVTVSDAPIRDAVTAATATGLIRPSRQAAQWHERRLRDRVDAAARALVGTPYSYLDYLSIALLHLGIRPAWLLRFVANRRHLICSQLVDEAYRAAGVHLFTDDRFSGDVTPGDLDRYRIGHLEGRPELATAA
jgi:cell wall-associated NlpC family hydrolase